MHLIKLTLFGFKSFADKTEVHFDKGVTCVVGPNGCGKSNISDSIRWVLGERSAKMLRGSKMEDVIFNGTDFRKPLAMCEVALTIDNHDRGLPIDYNEVTIARRLYRSGESEYLINKTACRLKDIQDLILDTGIGSNSYSMIEQGRIDYILSADPEKRRFLIEEAAGISKFKVKKEEAIRKLQRTEDNRVRLNDIIAEVKKNIQYAERQAKRAEKYKLQLEELKDLELKKAFYDLDKIAQTKEKLAETKVTLQSRIKEVEQSIDESRKIQAKLSETLRGILDKYASEDEKKHQVLSKVEQINQKIEFNQEKRMELASRRGQIEQELTQLQTNIENYTSEIKNKQEEVKGLENEKETAETVLSEARLGLENAEAELISAKKTSEQLKALVQDVSSQTSEIRSEFHRLTAFLDSSVRQIEKHEAANNRLSNEISEWQIKLQNYKADSEALGANIEETVRRSAALEEQLLGVQQDFERVSIDKLEFDRAIHESRARLEMLREIDQAAKSADDSFFAELNINADDLVRDLATIFDVQPGYEWALEAGLDSFCKTVVIENSESAELILKSLMDKNYGAMGILIKKSVNMLDQVSNSERPDHAGIGKSLADVVNVKDGFGHIFQSFFQDVFIIDSLPQEDFLKDLLPYAVNRKLISKEGLILGPHKRIFYRNSHRGAEDNLFKRKAEIEALEESLTINQRKVEELNSALDLKNAELTELRAELKQKESERLDFVVRKESFESLISGAVERLSGFEKELETGRNEKLQLESEQSRVREEKENAGIRLKELEERERESREQQANIAFKIEELDRKKTAAFEEMTSHKSRFESLDENVRLLSESLRLQIEHKEKDIKRTEVLSEESEKLKKSAAGLDISDKELNSEKETLDGLRRESEIALELIRQERDRAESELEASQEETNRLQNQLQVHQSEAHELAMSVKDMDYKEQNVHERLEQTYKMRLSEYSAQDYQFEGAPEDALARIEVLQKKVESIGAVNLLAIEEYEELKERYDTLLEQEQDLNDARDSLLETIRKINATTKGLFQTTFKSVQEAFDQYYQTLFRGGMAKLVLIDESNPLESGIDIVVRPPGKKLQNISLLSGGEKAMSAIALLFALFKIKPSPYCVLDEVDAPLDEANIDRFINVLQDFLTKTQFIIVTHNRKTIAMGDSLYGVTMQEAGVSKLVSVKVAQDKDKRLQGSAEAEEVDAVEETVSATEEEVEAPEPVES